MLVQGFAEVDDLASLLKNGIFGQTEIVQVPVTCRRLVPEKRTVQVPVTVYRTVPEEVIARTVVTPVSPVAPSASQPTPALVRREAIGGLSRLEKDPPRQGMSTAWRASSNLR